MFDLNNNIVINSNQEVFVFYLSQEGEIIYSIYDFSLNLLLSSSLRDKNVLRYTTYIDENNTIHLVALMKTGELNYYKYSDGIWSNFHIAKFDMKSNLYNQIEILIIKDKLNIIYNYSNLINSNIWTIQHVIYESKEKHNAVRYISKRIPDPFIVDADSQGTIHLLYRNNISNPQINHSFYSPYTKSWNSLSNQISSDNSNSMQPFLFIDSQDNLHGLWLEELDNKIELKYLKMSSMGKEKYIWKNIKLPFIKLAKYPPIIFEENNILKLVFLSNENIEFLYSSDYANSWIKGFQVETLDKDIILAKIKSNLNKANYIYCNSLDNPKLYFLDLSLYENALLHDEITTVASLDKEIESILAIDPRDIFLNELENKFNNILDNFNSIESIIDKILVNQNNIEDKLKNIQDSIDLKKPSFFDRLIR